MAYYPVEDTKVVYGKTKEEMEQNVAAAIAEGYAPVDDNSVWNAKLPEQTVAYRQAMVKRTNTDVQYIASMYGAFKSILEGINSQLAALNTKLNTANTHLNAIEANTQK